MNKTETFSSITATITEFHDAPGKLIGDLKHQDAQRQHAAYNHASEQHTIARDFDGFAQPKQTIACSLRLALVFARWL